jgi:hypothetical protein
MRGHSRLKDGVASLAYDPRIHEMAQQKQSWDLNSRRLGHGLPGHGRSASKSA